MRLGGLCISELGRGGRGEKKRGGRTQIYSDGGGSNKEEHRGRGGEKRGDRKWMQKTGEDWQEGKCLLWKMDERGMRRARM